jgi:peptidoglycan/xylan/chitin deacetylase (PgdA/CDA1 family)
MLGSMTKSRKGTLQNMMADGHELANHSYNHQGGAKAIKNQLKKTDEIIEQITNKKVTLMRPPGGIINNSTKHSGKSIILWSVDPYDWRDRNVKTITNRILQNTKSGSIILLHDIHPKSVRAALAVTKKLKEKGYALVTVSTLIGEPKKNRIYNQGRTKVNTMKLMY